MMKETESLEPFLQDDYLSLMKALKKKKAGELATSVEVQSTMRTKKTSPKTRLHLNIDIKQVQNFKNGMPQTTKGRYKRPVKLKSKWVSIRK